MASRPDYKKRLEALRTELKKQNLDGFLLPRMDKYQGEFVSAGAERLAWLTGFTGSAGIAVILQNKAAVFTDGRYVLQLNQQIDKNLYHAEDIENKLAAKWAAENAASGAVLGYDPWLHTTTQIEKMGATLAEKSIRLQGLENNPVDILWKDRPPFPKNHVEIFPVSVAGISGAQKQKEAAQLLKEKGFFAAVLAMPDSLMWLMNIRGADMEHTPVALSFGILYADARPLQWFTAAVIPPDVQKHIGPQVEILAPEMLPDAIDRLAAEAVSHGQAVAVDNARSADWFGQRLKKGGCTATDFSDPCLWPKAIKTASEQSAIRDAHMGDGLAVVRFLAWMETEGPKGKLTELDVVGKLEEFRKRDSSYKGPSFATIAGYGPNGAIVHYRASPETNRRIGPGNLLLVDSGGQYHYGTTDITRTLAIGTPDAEMCKHYTLVLKAHIAVAAAQFPEGTTGAEIDALARKPLLDAGLNYAHGTGHGVGCYLSVHEESASLSARGKDPLKAGMLLSNEPGYYRENHYGIRIENLVFVRRAEKKPADGKPLLEFETVTLVPFDRRLIQTDLLTPAERAWINDYQARVLRALAPHLEKPEAAWLEVQAQPL